MSARQFLKNIWWMMTEINFEDLVKASKVAADPQVAKNAASLEDILKDSDKFFKLIDKVMDTIEKAERSPMLSTAVRGYAKKQGVDIAPIKQPDPITIVKEVGVKPSSATHEQVYIELNKLTEEQLKKLLEAQKAQNDSIQAESGKPNNQ